MILKRLLIQNFKCYEKEEIIFSTGLTGIVGANGSGKSSIFDAIFFALYGKLSISTSFIRKSNKASSDVVSIELEFTAESKPYKVIREFRGKNLTANAYLYEQDNLIAEKQHVVTDAITKITGMDIDGFKHSVFSGQNELRVLSELQGEPRKKLIRKMLGLKHLDDILKDIRLDKNELDTRLNESELNLIAVEDEKVYKEKLVSLNDAESEAKKNKKVAKSLCKKIDLQIIEAKKILKIEELKYESYNELKNKESALLAEEKVLKSNIESLVKEKKELEQKEKDFPALQKEEIKYQKLIKQKKELELIREQIVKKEGFQSQINSYIKEKEKNISKVDSLNIEKNKKESSIKNKYECINALETLKNKSQKLRNIKTKLDAKKGSLDSEIKKSNNELSKFSKLGKESECPVCRRTLLEVFDNVSLMYTENIDKLNLELKIVSKDLVKNILEEEKIDKDTGRGNIRLKEIESIENDIKNIDKNINEYKLSISTYDKNIKKLEKDITILGKIQFEISEFNTVSTNIELLEDSHSLFVVLVQELKRKDLIDKERVLLNTKNEKIYIDIKDTVVLIKTLSFSLDEYQNKKNNTDKIIEEKSLADKDYYSHKETLAHLLGDIKVINDRITENNKKKALLVDKKIELKDLELLETCLDSFRQKILYHIRPLIAKDAGKLFQETTAGKYPQIKVDENFDFKIFDGDGWYPISRFSGGEVDLANLCLRVALSKAVTKLAGGKESGFLGFDEIFGSQDLARRTAILAALHNIGSEFSQVFIITHVESVIDEFPNVYKVFSDSSGSRIV